FATDLNNDAIAFARAGLYSQSIVNDVSPERRLRYFVQSGRGYRIGKQVHGMWSFHRPYIPNDHPLSPIYMVRFSDLLLRPTPAMQKKVIHTLHYSLKPSGLLLPDSSEAVGAFANLFKLEDKKRKIYSRIPGTSYMQFGFLPGADPMEMVELRKRAIQFVQEGDVDSAAQREADLAETAKAGRGRGANRGPASAKPSEAQLRRKLQATREYLRSVIEQHEAYAEELQSANEELQSSNEELQSVSEELDAAKQELQLSNDRLKQDKEKLRLQTSL